MKRCPECRRDYFDDSLMYCLDDGTALVQGAVPSPDEPQTAILHQTAAPGEAPTRTQMPMTKSPSLADTSHKPRRFPTKLAASVAAAVVILSIGFLGYRYYRADAKQISSIAVMPFVNESGSADVEYLSDGMSETLIKTLSAVPNLNVKARSSVFRYKGQESDVKKIGSELGVQAVLNGRIAERGEDVTLSLELIDAATENVLWTEQYIRKQADIVGLQNEIAGDVSASLKAKVSNAGAIDVGKRYTADARAYQLYLMGQFQVNKATPESQKQSIEYFKQAIEIDPNFAQAYSSMADAYTLLGTVFNAQMSAEEAMPNARSAAKKALDLDPFLSDAYVSLAWIEFRFDWDWAAAEADFKKALELDPKNAHAHHWYGEYLSCMGGDDEGIAEMRVARELEPFSVIINWNLGKNLFSAGRDDEALTELNKALELDGNFSRAVRLTSVIYEEKGMAKEAFAAFLKQPEVARLPQPNLPSLQSYSRPRESPRRVGKVQNGILPTRQHRPSEPSLTYCSGINHRR